MEYLGPIDNPTRSTSPVSITLLYSELIVIQKKRYSVHIRVLTLASVLMAIATRAGEITAPLYMGRQSQEFIMAKIHVSNMHRSYDFYTKVVGLREVVFPGEQPTAIDDDEAKLIELCLNFSGSPRDAYIILMKEKGVVPSAEYAQQTVIGVKTSDTRSTVERAKASGYTVTFEPVLFRGVLVGIVSDPDGYGVEIMQGPSVPRMAK
jgi:predicted enzyme related to lactoylglutathione lyase